MARRLLITIVENLFAPMLLAISWQNALWCKQRIRASFMVQHFTKLLRIDFIIVDNMWRRYEFCSVCFCHCLRSNTSDSLLSLTYAP